MNPELAAAIIDIAKRNQWNPVDLGTAISYETAGTFDPWKAGPRTQWGQHRGLIQWGEPQAKQYGVTQDMSVTDQMGAVERYLKDRGLKPGAGLLDLYSTINAGSPGRYDASDANNGGAPGTVADKVAAQMGGHADNARRLLGGALTPEGGAVVEPPMPAAPMPMDVGAPLSLAPPGIAGAGGDSAVAMSPQGQQAPMPFAPPRQQVAAEPEMPAMRRMAMPMTDAIKARLFAAMRPT